MHIVGPLQSDDYPLDRAEEGKGHGNRDGNEDDRVQPQAWLEGDLSPYDKRDNDMPDNENGEIGWCVVSPLVRKVLAACGAFVPNRQEA